MMLIGLFFFMNFLEILNQIIDMCNIEEFSDNIRWFNVSNCLDIFLDCFIEIILSIEIITMKSWYLCKQSRIWVLIFSEFPSYIEERSLEEILYFESIFPFFESNQFLFWFISRENEMHKVSWRRKCLDLLEGLLVRNVLIKCIENSNLIIFILFW